jgi:hypothetical protein
MLNEEVNQEMSKLPFIIHHSLFDIHHSIN